jgi:hypothetical protein
VPDILSQALAPLQSFTSTSPQSVIASRWQINPCPFRGSFPLQRLSTTRSHIPLVVSNSPVVLRPQGFSPSRRLTPRATFQACFILVPLLGFTLRGLHPPMVPYALSSAAPLRDYLHRGQRQSSLQGLAHHKKPGHQAWVLARLLARLPPWVFLLRGFLPVSNDAHH